MSRRSPPPLRARRWATSAIGTTALLLVASLASAQPNRYVQRNLVSSVPGLAANTDPQLINPWGISFGPTTPFWTSDNGANVTTLYNGAGVKQALVVSIPGVGNDPGNPTGQVFNATGAFSLGNGSAARFLFATEQGMITGWNPAAGTTAIRLVDNSAAGASYTGLAIAGSGATARLYGANFGAGTIDVWDGNFTAVPGGFVDPNLPAGYSPFNVQAIGSSVYVMYAVVDPITGDEVAGAGLGIVDEFATDGTLLRRLVSPGGALNAPWGVALAPSTFGTFGGSLLVGNFGNGMINAFDPFTGALRGTLLNAAGNPLVNDGLWGIAFGNGGPGFDPNRLYFAAGIDDETQGLFGSIAAIPEPTTTVLVATGLGALLVTIRRRRTG